MVKYKSIKTLNKLKNFICEGGRRTKRSQKNYKNYKRTPKESFKQFSKYL